MIQQRNLNQKVKKSLQRAEIEIPIRHQMATDWDLWKEMTNELNVKAPNIKHSKFMVYRIPKTTLSNVDLNQIPIFKKKC